MEIDQKIRYSVNQEKMDKIIRNAVICGNHMNPHKIKAILYFMYFVGCRVGELLHLRREDIDLVNNRVILRRTKSKKHRKAYFTQEVCDLLKVYFAIEPYEFFNAFNLTLKKINFLFEGLKKFDKKITPHVMRHSFAQHLVRKRIDIRIIKELLGHADIKTTMIYCNPDDETIEEVYQSSMKVKQDGKKYVG